MFRTLFVSTRTTVPAVLVLFAVSGVCHAQPDANIQMTTHNKIRPGRVGEFRDVAAKLVALCKEAGCEQSWTVWAKQSGEREFVTVTNHKKWADLDVQPGDNPKFQPHLAEWRVLMARLNDTIESSSRVIGELQPDLSIQTGRATSIEQMPALARVHRVKVRQERMNDFMKLIKDEVMPGNQKGGVKWFGVFRSRFGAPANEVRTVTFLDKWAALDSPAPLRKALGEDGFQAMAAKWSTMVEEHTWDIVRFQKEMTYIPASGPTLSSSSKD